MFVVVVLLTAFLLTNLVSAQAQAGAETVVDFDVFATGMVPLDFSVALTGGGDSAFWVIQEDPTAPSGKQVLTQTSTDGTAYRFPLCVYDKVTAKDVDVSVKFKPIRGKEDQAAGIVWRYVDKDNYYVVRANALENNVVLYKVEKGKRSDLKPIGASFFAYGKKVPVPDRQWSTLRLTARGNHFAVYLNEQHLFDVQDSTFAEAGKVGLWTKADSVTSFDDLKIESHDTND
ncbi:MAG: family 16 glycoside hydrolase [Candidatus Binatia bacterium]